MGMITRGERWDASNNKEKVALEEATWELIYRMLDCGLLQDSAAFQMLKYKYLHIPAVNKDDVVAPANTEAEPNIV
jgi:hypothetical protein